MPKTSLAIIVPLRSDAAWYSLTSVIKAQARMLSEYGHKVVLFVGEDYDGCNMSGVQVKRVLPVGELKDYRSINDITPEHVELSTKTAEVLAPWLVGFDYIFTHDLVFTGRYLPYSLAIRSVSDYCRDLHWYNWIHSYPTGHKDWWDISLYHGDHKLVFPSKAGISQVAKAFLAPEDLVLHIPHIKDIRDELKFTQATNAIVDLFPAILQSDIVQCYPASTDRFNSKGIRDIIVLFGLLKHRGKSVCLIIPNQFSDRRSGRIVDPIKYYEKVARRNGLRPYEDFIFTSEILGEKYTEGLPHRIVSDLMACSNLFIFPSRSESFGFILTESILSGGCLPVLNTSSPAQMEVAGNQGIPFDFGDGHTPLASTEPESGRFNRLVDEIIDRMTSNPVIAARTHVRQCYNQDTIYKTYYESALRSY